MGSSDMYTRALRERPARLHCYICYYQYWLVQPAIGENTHVQGIALVDYRECCLQSKDKGLSRTAHNATKTAWPKPNVSEQRSPASPVTHHRQSVEGESTCRKCLHVQARVSEVLVPTAPQSTPVPTTCLQYRRCWRVLLILIT